jgi:SAM-dependent methyltransferase
VTNDGAAETSVRAKVLGLAAGHIVARAVQVAAEFGLADMMEDGPRTAAELALESGSDELAVYRLLRSLTGHGFFAEGSDGRFSLGPLGVALRSSDPSNLRSAVRALGVPGMWNAVGKMSDSVRTGRSALLAARLRAMYDHADNETARLVRETMIGFHGDEPEAIVAAYDFSLLRRIVDIGGGAGNLIATILLANPHLEGILFDLPANAAAGRASMQRLGLSERCRVMGGDFFKAVPKGCDAYLLSHVLHDWPEDQALKIVENCRRAMAPDGRLLIVEDVIADDDQGMEGKAFDLLLLATVNGRVRRAGEYADFLARAGFRIERIVRTSLDIALIEAVAT